MIDQIDGRIDQLFEIVRLQVMHPALESVVRHRTLHCDNSRSIGSRLQQLQLEAPTHLFWYQCHRTLPVEGRYIVNSTGHHDTGIMRIDEFHESFFGVADKVDGDSVFMEML